MRRPAPFIAAILTLVSVPIFYNSCQGGIFGGKGFSASKSACKVGLYKGELKSIADLAPESPFKNGKVQLSASFSSSSGLQKAEDSGSVKLGTELGIVIDNSCAQKSAINLKSIPLTQIALLGVEPDPNLDQQAYLWKTDREYSTAELSTLADADACVVGVSWNHTYRTQALNDPERLYQTHLTSIHFDESLPFFYNSGGGMNQSTGNPVLVAVVDSGVDWQHPDLFANMWQHQQGVGVDITTLNGTINYNPMDISTVGHGTHVAGLIAAVSNNSMGVSGAMPFRAQVMPIKVFTLDANGEMTTTSQHFFNALRFAHRNGAKVINLSLGSINFAPATDALAESAVTEALGEGVTIVTVTGNAENGANGAEINGSTLTVIPAMYATKSGVIGVGSYDTRTGLKSFFSHYSTTYGEIAAPGAEEGVSGLYSTKPRALSSYGRLAGTSQAAPLVSAAAALTIGLIREAYQVAPTPQEVERLIEESAKKDANLTTYFKNGNRLDLLNLVQKINTDYPLTKNSATKSNVGVMDLSSTSCY